MSAELRPLVALAEAVDRARGRSMDGLPVATIAGCDIAETLGNLVARLDLEVGGPKGRES